MAAIRTKIGVLPERLDGTHHRCGTVGSIRTDPRVVTTRAQRKKRGKRPPEVKPEAPKTDRFARLRAALKPFAAVDLSRLDQDMEDVWLYIGRKDFQGEPHLKLSDFENAREVLGD